MRQVRNQLGLCISQSDQGAQAILKRKESQAQLLSNWKKQQRGHAILFLYLAIQQQYGKILDDMENARLRKKDPYLNNVSEACRLLIGWCNNYRGQAVLTEAYDGMVFTTESDDKEDA